MWKILLEEFFGDLRTQKTRTFLTMFSITWGTVAIVLLLAFGEGLKHQISTGLLNAGEKIFMTYGGETSKEFEGLPRGRRIRLTEEDMDLVVRSVEDVDMASPSYGRWGVTLSYGDVKTTTYMEGVHPPFSELRKVFPRTGGRFINEQDVKERRRVLFLGDSIAYRLFGDEDPVGKTLDLDGLPYIVIGVMQGKFQDSMNNGPDEERAIIPASTFKAVYGYRYVNHILFHPRSKERAPRTKAEIFEVLGAKHRFDPTDERALPMWDFIESEQETKKIGTGIQLFLGMVGLFTLLVAGVGIANIMYVVVEERTREIGIKMALGAKKAFVLFGFIVETAILTIIGGGVGYAIASAIIWVVSKVDIGDIVGTPMLSLVDRVVVVAILGIISLLAACFPARKAANMNPVQALKA